MLVNVASTRSKGFDWKGFWAMWDGFPGKIDFLALMASDANTEISGDWLEQYLRDEIARRRAAPPELCAHCAPMSAHFHGHRRTLTD
jgi:hypothetical protein